MNADEPQPSLDTRSLSPTHREGENEDTATEFFDMSWGGSKNDDAPGAKIGKYHLLTLLGEGGFGTVWKAEQQEPVRREVAIKILKLGMDSREVVARFAQERQALAIMEHPGIARVYDAGVTESGRPYFVMELVRGEPLQRYCDREQLDTHARLELFVQVCSAIHHAHRKGIIHRDLKPGNILVMQTDNGLQPKVIDFGIAKATTSLLPDMSMQTRVGQFMGTPAYMSPEQAEGQVLDLDMRSDVYSLGVILYELLTGELPFYSHDEKRLSYDELRRRIREQSPARPSTKIKALKPDRLAHIAASHSAEPLQFVRVLRGDLDWIALKALERDRERRYDSAHDLAADIERHLANLPVLACPPSTGYVLSRFAARHRVAVVSAALIATTLVAALVVSTVMFFNEQRARKEADIQTDRSQQIVKIMKDMIMAAGPSVAQGRDTALMKDILSATAKRIDSELQDKPEIELEMRKLLAQAYLDIGEFQPSHAMNLRIVELERTLFPNQPLKFADSLSALAGTLEALDRLDEAQRTMREVIALRQTARPLPLEQIAVDRELLAWLLARDGDFVGAESESRRALEEFPKQDAEDPQARGQILLTLGLALLKTAQFAEAESVHREVVELYNDTFSKPHPKKVTALNNLCHLLCEVGKFDEVEMSANDALAMQELLDGTPIGVCTDSLNKALAVVYWHRHEHEKAIACLRAAIDAGTQVYGADHRFTNDKRSLLIQLQLEAGLLDDAAKTVADAKQYGGEGKSADNSLGVAYAKYELALGNLADAERLAEEDLRERRKESKQPSITQVEAMQTLAMVYARQGKPESAIRLLREAESILRPKDNPHSVMLKSVQKDLKQLGETIE